VAFRADSTAQGDSVEFGDASPRRPDGLELEGQELAREVASEDGRPVASDTSEQSLIEGLMGGGMLGDLMQQMQVATATSHASIPPQGLEGDRGVLGMRDRRSSRSDVGDLADQEVTSLVASSPRPPSLTPSPASEDTGLQSPAMQRASVAPSKRARASCDDVSLAASRDEGVEEEAARAGGVVAIGTALTPSKIQVRLTLSFWCSFQSEGSLGEY
jgi:hypothetical protein